MKKKILFITLGILTFISGYCQTFFFEEGFENNGNIPEEWEVEYVKETLNWRYENGGHSNNPSIPNSRRPTSAHNGSYNALFEKGTIEATITKLITPPIDLSLSIKPELRFWYANFERNILSDENDIIRVYYRSVDATDYEWVLLQEITEATLEWTESFIPIPDSAHFRNIELAFEGEIGPGWGACIDDISIIETGVVPKYLKSIKGATATNSEIPTGAKSNPVLRLDLTVKGNDGSLKIDTLKVTPLLNTLDVISNAQLYFTTSPNFNTLDSVDANFSIENNLLIFTDVNKNIPFGYSHLWITVDIPEDTHHEFSEKKVDVMIKRQDITVNGLKYPFAELNPYGSRKIKEAIFFDDFENSNYWDLTGDFEIGEPQGLGGAYGNSDPNYAYEGKKAMGNDLTGKGTYLGDYENNLNLDANLATSTESSNCKYYKDINIQFHQWLNVEGTDKAKIQININNSDNWITTWENSNLISNESWINKTFDISEQADRKNDVKPRFSIGPTNTIWTFSGWNIDRLAITGTFIHTDVGMYSWESPKPGCGHLAPEQLIVKIKNYGFDAINGNIPLGYSIDNGAWVMETINMTLAQDEIKEVVFSDLVDLTTPGKHYIQVKTFLPSDQDNNNNLLDTTIYIVPNYTIPYTENFEENGGFWRSFPDNKWQYGTPNGTSLNEANSGTKCWGTNLSGNYENNDSMVLESPCFDFSSATMPMVEVMIKGNSAPLKDGLTMHYSIDEGNSWKIVPNTSPYNWNWYTKYIGALNSKGWDASSNEWFMARQILPNDVLGNNSVKIRFVFMADESINNEGFLIDDIRIYDAPIDAGVSEITNPQTQCFLSENETVDFKIKNYGIRNITPNDELIAHLMINNEIVAIDTFYSPTPIQLGETQNFSFTNTANMLNQGEYKFKVYTAIEQDSNMYTSGVSNDTLIKSIYVLGEPHYTLGPDIGTMQPDTVVLDAGAGYTAYLWQDGSSSQTFNVSSGGNFSVTVTNSNNCQSTSSIKVIESVTDLAVTAINGLPASGHGCQGSVTPNLLEVTIKNNGLSYSIGDTIQAGYQINNEPKIVETIHLTEAFMHGNTINYKFTNPNQPDLTIPGIKNFKCFSVFIPDLDYSNDTLEQSIEIYELPTIDLGKDTLFTHVDNPIVLDAGDNLQNYMWQDGSTNQTFSISEHTTKKYHVRASDLHNCATASDTIWVIADEWELDTILSPINACSHSNIEEITIRLKNNSQNSYSSGYTFPAKINFDNQIINENIVLNAPLIANGSVDYTFSNTIDLSERKNYELTVNIMPIEGIDLENNNYTKSITTYEYFTVDLGADTVATLLADTILLDASNNFANYSWNKGGHNQTYQITSITSDLYKVTASDEHNCYTTKDSVQILASDLLIDEIINPKSVCDLTDANEIKFVIQNVGNDIIPAATNMSVFYKLDDGNWKELPFTIQYDLEPGLLKTITIQENINLLGKESYDFSLAIRYEKDLFFKNDTISTTIFEFERPTVDLGYDVIYTSQADTIILEAQEGQTNYQWQDLSQESFFNVTQNSSETYHVIVSNAYGCTDSDTVSIYTYDIGIESINQITTCSSPLEDNISINIQMNSNDTLEAGSQIIAKYIFNGTEVSETVTLTERFTSESVYNYTFSELLSISDTGNYTITCSVEMPNEVNTNNNQKDLNFRIGTHFVDLGDDFVSHENPTIINAGNPAFESYIWSTGATTPYIEVTNSGKYEVTARDTNSCESKDSINITIINSTYTISEIIGFENNCINSNSQPVSFNLKNTGDNTILEGSTIDIEYSTNITDTIKENFTFEAPFSPNDEVLITFNSLADVSATGEHTIHVAAILDNFTSKKDSVIHTWGEPNIDLGDDITTYEDSVILDAGNHQSYIWSTQEISSTIIVKESGKYKVKVSNQYGCYSSDSISVLFLNPSYNITEIINLSDACEHDANTILSFNFKNTGNDTIFTDSTMNIKYVINTNDTVSELFTFENKFAPNNELTISFETPIDLSTPNQYQIQVMAKLDSTLITIDTTVNTWGLPNVDLGEDIGTDLNIVTLDAGFGFSSYLWNTGATTQSIEVYEDGQYWVEVSNESGCINKDTIQVNFIPIALQVTELTSPAYGCGSITNEKVIVKVTNSGTKTVHAGTIIMLGYQIENEDRIDESVEFVSDFSSGMVLNHTFNNDVSITESGTHNVSFYTSYDGNDLDTANYQIIIHEKPDFFNGNDTIKVTSYPYEINANVTADSYLWNTGENTETITVSSDNWYLLTINLSNNCEFTDSVFTYSFLQIENQWGSDVKIYPNPTTDAFNIIRGNSHENVLVEITDIKGSVLYRKDNMPEKLKVNTQTWKQGVYIIKIYNSERQAIFQIVKQ